MNWFERVPKVELHLHLEGAIPHDALWQLIVKYGGDPSVPDRSALAHRFRYRDFPHFLEIWLWKNGYLREYDDFVLIAEAVAQDLARQNIRYVEAFFSPSDFSPHGLATQQLVEAIRRGLSRVPEIEVALIADLVRDTRPARASVTLAEIHEVQELGVVGIGIGGAEHLHPPEPFASVYEQARRFGLRTTAHAGESMGAESIWGALRSLRVDRIGHGTRAEEDGALLDFLVEHQVPLEMCPTSNVATGVVHSVDDHPIRRYFERGILVTVNTDDPSMFGNSLATEYQILEERLGFSRDEIRALILQGIRASWLPGGGKERLAATFVQDRGWHG
jgi:adenosine deaminase